MVKERKDYEEQWRDYYPDEVKWYRLTAIENETYGYQCVYLGEGVPRRILEAGHRRVPPVGGVSRGGREERIFIFLLFRW